MARYIALVNWTDQGIKNVKDSPARLAAARDLAKKYGCEMLDFHMTIGIYDMVVTIEAPNDEAAARFILALGSGGNIRTTTLKAFPEAAYREIVASF